MSASSSDVGQVAVKIADTATLGGSEKNAVPKAAPTGKSTAPFKFNRTASVAMLLNPCCWILWLLDFVVWLICFLLWPPTTIKFIKFWMPGRMRSYMGMTLIDGKPVAYRTLAQDNELLNQPFGVSALCVILDAWREGWREGGREGERSSSFCRSLPVGLT